MKMQIRGFKVLKFTEYGFSVDKMTQLLVSKYVKQREFGLLEQEFDSMSMLVEFLGKLFTHILIQFDTAIT